MKVKQYPLYLMLSPSIAFLIIFVYIPIYGITVAFKDFSMSLGIFKSPWAAPAWNNFFFLADNEFWNVFKNTIRIASIKFIFVFPAPILVALLINEIRGRYKRVIQTVLYLPHFVSWVIFAGIIYRLLGGDNTSPFNLLRGLLGMRPADILTQESAFIPIVVLTNLIKETGWGTIIYLAAITGVSQELYDAAYADGCSRLQMTRFVTLPSLLPIIVIMLVLSIPTVLSAGFDQIWNLTNPMVARSSNILDIYIIRIGIQSGRYSYGVAIGLFVQILAFALVMLSNKIGKKSFGYGLW